MTKLAAQLTRYMDKELFGGSIEPTYRLVCICDELDNSQMGLTIFWIDPSTGEHKWTHVRESIASLELAKFDLLTYTCDAAIRMGW